jgi:class 3 adenylate cyclase/tetratricopeptide (TPR) repeat protein
MANEARKTVTVVFTDVTGSTSLGEELDPEALRGVMARYFETAQTVLERHGGTVEKFIGDAVMAVFGIPTMHEDDALRAVRAAAELREQLDGLNEELQRERGVRIALRTGVNTGEVVVGDPGAQHFYATGDAVNVAARLEQAAAPGEILIGDSTRQLVRDAVELEAIDGLDLKGKSELVAAWRLAAVRAEAAPFTRHLDSPLVGREDELNRMLESFEESRGGRRPGLCTVLGMPGVGKSRLVAELRARVADEATVVVGRCLSYGEGITFWPLVEIVNELERRFSLPELIAERPLEQVRALTGSGEASGSTEESFWAIRKLLEAVARQKPLVVVLDDVHWAEPTLLDLVEHILEFTDAPLLIVASARPEFFEQRPLWASQREEFALIRLEPLTEAQAETLIDALASDKAFSPEIRNRIGAASEGNPLFVEQMVAMLAENGNGENGHAVPPTIQALLAARIDELGPDERFVIEPAAVIGHEFWREALVELSPKDLAVSAALQRLIRKELIARARSSFAEEDAFRFRHILIRDAAYAGIPKARRAELHERFADWLERQMPEFEEIIGYHLEQAYEYQAQLGPTGDRAHSLARRAAELLGSAGLRASDRGDFGAATKLLGRSVALLPPGDAFRLQLLPELGLVIDDAGRLEEAQALLADTIREAGEAGDRRAEMRARIELATIRSAHTQEPSSEVAQLVEAALEFFEGLGDDVGLATTWQLKCHESWSALRWQEMAESLERALAYARRTGRRSQIMRSLTWLSSTYAFGPLPADEARERLEAIRGEFEPESFGDATTLTFLGWMEALRGDFETARDLYRQGIERLVELGANVRRGGRSMVGGDIELLAGDAVAAEAELRAGFDTLEAIGEKGLLSTVAAVLAEALYRQGRDSEAEHYTHVSAENTGPGDIASEVRWRNVRAKLLARRGEFDEADRLGLEAVRFMEQTDSLAQHADALVSRAEVLRLAGRADEAATALEEAMRLYERKGVLPQIERTRALLSELTG